MAGGTTVSSIAIQLSRLLARIDNRLLAAIASPQTVAPHQMNNNPLLGELQGWQHQLDLYQRRLKQVDSQLDFRESRVRSVPRHLQFRERQSIGSHRDSLAAAERLAREVRSRLRQLIHRSLVPGDVEATNMAFDLIDDMLKETREVRDWVDKAQREGILTRDDAVQIKSVVSDTGAQYQNLVKTQPVGTDWLLLLTLTMRIAHMIVLRARNNRT